VQILRRVFLYNSVTLSGLKLGVAFIDSNITRKKLIFGPYSVIFLDVEETWNHRLILNWFQIYFCVDAFPDLTSKFSLDKLRTFEEVMKVNKHGMNVEVSFRS